MKSNYRNILTLLVGFFFCGVLFAQPPRVVYSTDEIRIGEQVEVSLKVGYPGAQQSIVFPAIGDTLVKNVEVVSKTAIDTINEEGAVKLAQTIIITSFDSGYYAIPPFDFKVGEQNLETEAFLLEVKTVPVDTTAFIRDIKDIYSVSVGFSDYLLAYWPWIAGGLVLVAIIAALLIYLKKRKKKASSIIEKPVEEPSLPADVVALSALHQIKKEKIWSRHKVKEYHTEITDVLRTYIENRFEVKAHEQTSSEILRNLRFAEMDESSKNSLRRTLLLADMVKFAKEDPLADENEKSIDDAIRFVELTKQQENGTENKKIENAE